MLEEPVDFKEGNKINLITFSSTKYHITELNKITEFMLKKKNLNGTQLWEEEQVLHTEHDMVQSSGVSECSTDIFLSARYFLVREKCL